MSTALDEDITVLENLEFETPCTNDDGLTAKWVVVLRSRPCGCDVHPVVLFCESCHRHWLKNWNTLVDCVRCKKSLHKTIGELTVNIERL